MAKRRPTSRRRPRNASDLRTLRRLLAAAGSRDELDRWIDDAEAEAEPARGRKHNKFDGLMLAGLAHMCRKAKAERGISYYAMVKLFVASLRGPETGKMAVHFGASEQAVAKRLYKKLVSTEFSDRALVEHFAKFDIDLSQSTLRLPGDDPTSPGPALLLR
jgi:hypothetical protein